MIKRIFLSALGGIPSISYIKHLQSNGYFVIGIDSNKSSIGFNFAMSFILYPDNNQHIKPSSKAINHSFLEKDDCVYVGDSIIDRKFAINCGFDFYYYKFN